ncbi:SLAP domain-containing protein [Companilactobacillus mishanensis]|uniref:S-layer protein C-terminal domain-containing protein n=1 Tax=Companilactobacillus mishanensis TaxID=2486008 RepID=A0ABW9P7U1_9LACO|nr:SLAP domain-containing protein [Companilactobacillus mishanensis]MQS45137.1 hypothetical protein [Companilactobacillus mishanensis]
MKKSKSILVTSAVVASLALGTVSTAVTSQTSQASIIDNIQNIFSGAGSGISTTGGIDVKSLKTITLPAGADPNDSTTIEAAIGGTPTFYGMIPAKVTSVDDKGDGTGTIHFGPDFDNLGSIGKALQGISGIVLNAEVDYKTASSITFANGATSLNTKKGDKISLKDDQTLYKMSDPNATATLISDGGFNYAYPGTYSITVQAVNDSTKSEETTLTVNVLDATIQNANQTVLQGSDWSSSNKATAQDSLGQALDLTSSNVNTSKVGSQNVTYTGVDPSLGADGEPITFTFTGTVNVVKADANLTVNFQDASTSQIVDTTTLTGASGQSVDITAPSGYDLVNSSDSSVTLQKGSNAKTVQVIKSGSSVATPFSGTIATFPNGGVVPLYNGEGTQSTRSLGADSAWQSDQTKTINGEKYYRVSTDEWVKASQVYEYSGQNRSITTNSGAVKALYATDGSRSNRSLAPGSAWFTDKLANINGTQMYRVSTNEWVAASDVN